jgi:hypothetical protein
MRPGDVVGMVARPAMSGTMHARQVRKDGAGVTWKQVLGYIVVAAFTTWLTKQLDDMIDEAFAPRPAALDE